MFYVIRHGETDTTASGTKIYQGLGYNLQPLSAKGIQQVKKTAQDPRLRNADIIITSPFTRAVQTAGILSKELGIDFAVETDLHEWVGNKHYNFDAVPDNAIDEFTQNNGNYPEGTEQPWEDNAILKNRLLTTFAKYDGYKNVIVVCHGMLIFSLFQKYPENAEILEYKMDGGQL